jgi:hypothetical protein
LVTTGTPSIVDWWLLTFKRVHKLQRKGFGTMFALVAWSLWLERNVRVFNKKSLMADQLASQIWVQGSPMDSSGFQRPWGHHPLMFFTDQFLAWLAW